MSKTATVITAPNSLIEARKQKQANPNSSSSIRIFLAGSIEMGTATLWQDAFIKNYRESTYSHTIIMNPRRPDWDSTWEQSYQNGNFYQQVNWELDALDLATHIVMYFDPATKSPISLLELGLYAASKKLMVICPDGYWKKGNVDVVCDRYDISQFNSMEEILNRFK